MGQEERERVPLQMPSPIRLCPAPERLAQYKRKSRENLCGDYKRNSKFGHGRMAPIIGQGEVGIGIQSDGIFRTVREKGKVDVCFGNRGGR
jgi:hypothetical protein